MTPDVELEFKKAVGEQYKIGMLESRISMVETRIYALERLIDTIPECQHQPQDNTAKWVAIIFFVIMVGLVISIRWIK